MTRGSRAALFAIVLAGTLTVVTVTSCDDGGETDRDSDSGCGCWFDDLVIATRYIGPIEPL